jgi:hypothetical protein
VAVVFTQADLDNLKAALVSGAMEVTIGDRTIKYRTQKDLLAAIEMVSQYLDGVSDDVDDLPDIIRPTFSRGES